MLDENTRAVIGDNQPPCPIELVIAEHDAVISEAHNWADGEPVQDEASMKAVDVVLKGFKTYKTALGKAGKERTDPLHKAWKAEVAAVKVYTDDADRLQKCLVDIVGPFKAKLAEEKRQAERAAWEAAEKARQEAAAKEAEAKAGDIESQREAEQAKQAVIDAEKAAKAASKDKPKGMREVITYVINDDRAALHWIAKNDKPAMAEFIAEYVRRNHKSKAIDGVDVTKGEEAF